MAPRRSRGDRKPGRGPHPRTGPAPPAESVVITREDTPWDSRGAVHPTCGIAAGVGEKEASGEGGVRGPRGPAGTRSAAGQRWGAAGTCRGHRNSPLPWQFSPRRSGTAPPTNEESRAPKGPGALAEKRRAPLPGPRGPTPGGIARDAGVGSRGHPWPAATLLVCLGKEPRGLACSSGGRDATPGRAEASSVLDPVPVPVPVSAPPGKARSPSGGRPWNGRRPRPDSTPVHQTNKVKCNVCKGRLWLLWQLET